MRRDRVEWENEWVGMSGYWTRVELEGWMLAWLDECQCVCLYVTMCDLITVYVRMYVCMYVCMTTSFVRTKSRTHNCPFIIQTIWVKEWTGLQGNPDHPGKIWRYKQNK